MNRRWNTWKGLRAAAIGCIAIVISMMGRPGMATAQMLDSTGSGWLPTLIDLDVRLDPERERLALRADMVLRLEDHERSDRLILVVNARDSIMGFDSVLTSRGVVAKLDGRQPGRPSTRAAIIEFADDPPARGEGLRVTAYASSRRTSSQFTLDEGVALASWVTAWYPVPLPSGERGLGGVTKAPGRTRFDLPAGWRVVSNGVRVESRLDGGRRWESWLTDQPLARSFSAAPYRITAAEVEGRGVELFLLTVDEASGREQARALAGAIAALEQRFGPYPTGSYAIAEVPDRVPGFLASSEQGFMMAKPENFEVPGGNIPLFAHEASHGYWGNLVNSVGPGSSFLDESMAQYGAVIALEEMLGPGAAREFLKFSREGYIPRQSARGYFEVVRRGADSVAIADLENLDGIAKRVVVNSKGTWILHMLRDLVGDDRFFATLRRYLRDHVDRSANLDAFRDAFRQAAPDVDVGGFFAQWLDRTGAPRLDVDYQVTGDEVEIVVEQLQAGGPFRLSLEVRVESRSGAESRHRVEIEHTREVFRLPAPDGVSSVMLDPDFEVLRWDKAYRMEGG